jgi:hypothetical protein
MTLKPIGVALMVSVLAVVSACQKPTTTKRAVDEPAFQKPTATEYFNLRTKCAELGTKINEEYDFAFNITFKMPFLRQEQFSHYDPKTNRCYVELRVTVNTNTVAFIMALPKRNAKISKLRDGFVDFLEHNELSYMEYHLYDGQTSEELASLQNGLKGVTPTGVIVGRSTKVEWIDALEEINNRMGR